MCYIKCDNAAFSYEGKTVLSDVSFSVGEGDYLCIVGENGSGKSTLIKGLLGLKKPSGGNIEFMPDVRRSDIGYLPQRSDIQRDFPASVMEVVLSGRLNSMGKRLFYSAGDKREATSKLELMGVAGLKNKSYQELSGGQQQRVLLARALTAANKILILDEPVAGLDPEATCELYGLIERINREMKMTIIMVSHDMSAAIRYASHVLCLGHKQLFWGSTSDYTESPYYYGLVGGAVYV